MAAASQSCVDIVLSSAFVHEQAHHAAFAVHPHKLTVTDERTAL
jgi:hypothetical protein